MKRPILRMAGASFHPAPIVNRSDSRFIDLPSINPLMAAGATVACLDDDGAMGWASGGMNDLSIVALAFGAFHGDLLMVVDNPT